MSVFQVTMLDVLKGDFERWLAERGLMMMTIPSEVIGGDPDYVVVAKPGSPLTNELRQLDEARHGVDEAEIPRQWRR